MNSFCYHPYRGARALVKYGVAVVRQADKVGHQPFVLRLFQWQLDDRWYQYLRYLPSP